MFGCQPLCIAGVTGACSSTASTGDFCRRPADARAVLAGPITVFNKTIYEILAARADAPIYLHFIGCVRAPSPRRSPPPRLLISALRSQLGLPMGRHHARLLCGVFRVQLSQIRDQVSVRDVRVLRQVRTITTPIRPAHVERAELS